MMRVSELGAERTTLSKYMDDYVDGDGWKSNAADKVILNQAIIEFHQASDSIEKKISALELIRTFEQDGTKASEWFKTSAAQSEYTPALMEVLRKLVGVWNRKLRGVKTYVFVNEIINYMIHELHQVPTFAAVSDTVKVPSESAKALPLTLVVSDETKERPATTPTSNSGSSLKFVAPSQKVTDALKTIEKSAVSETTVQKIEKVEPKIEAKMEAKDQKIATVPVSVVDTSIDQLKETEMKILDNISSIEHLATETQKLSHSLQQTLDSKQKEFEQENKMHETMLNDFNREKSEHEKLLKQLETKEQELAQIQKNYEDKIKTLEAKLSSIAKIIS